MSDAFADAFALLAAAADVKGFEARISRLKKLSEQVAAEQAQLLADRAAHQREVAEAGADLDKRRGKLAEGEAELNMRRRAFELRQDRADSSVQDYPTDPNFAPNTRHPNGMLRGPE